MKYFLIYFVVINLLTFSIWGIDKRKAKHNKWRIKESSLLILSLLGGRVGAFFAIDTFRHKTIKSRFVRKLYIIGILWICGFLIAISL